MVDAKTIKAQLKAIDDDHPFWVNSEIRELPNIIVPNETIKHLVAGRYEGGFALLVATDHRMLIIDKKPMFLSVEDIRYEMIAEVDFGQKLFDSVVNITTFNKSVWFNSFWKKQLRAATHYVQQRLSEMRNQQVQTTPNQAIEQLATASQNEEAEPYSSKDWEKVNERVNSARTMATNPMFIRRRVGKFTVPNALPEIE